MTKIIVLLAAGAALWAEPLKQGERDRAMSYLHATRKQFLDSVAGLSQAQWEFKPSPQSWSIAEVAEHIALSEDLLFDLVTKKIMAMPGDPAKLEQTKGMDDKIAAMMTNRSQKVQAPETLRPTHRWKTAAELIAHFKESRDRNIAYLQTTGDDLRGHSFYHPALKELDGYQWLLMMAGHSERHTMQLNEVKTAAGYPEH